MPPSSLKQGVTRLIFFIICLRVAGARPRIYPQSNRSVDQAVLEIFRVDVSIMRTSCCLQFVNISGRVVRAVTCEHQPWTIVIPNEKGALEADTYRRPRLIGRPVCSVRPSSITNERALSVSTRSKLEKHFQCAGQSLQIPKHSCRPR